MLTTAFDTDIWLGAETRTISTNCDSAVSILLWAFTDVAQLTRVTYAKSHLVGDRRHIKYPNVFCIAFSVLFLPFANVQDYVLLC